MTASGRVWELDKIPLALDNSPIVEGGSNWPNLAGVDSGKFQPPPEGPLEIVWKRSLAKLNDFCWPALHHTPALKAEIADELAERFNGFSLIDVQYIKDFSWKTPLPYEKLFDKKPLLKVLYITHCIDADEERSTIVVKPVCGDDPEQLGMFIEGIEEKESIQKPVITGKWRVKTTRRLPEHGIFIRTSDLEGCDFFRINQNRSGLYCTDSARDFIIDSRFSGVDFLEVGEII